MATIIRRNERSWAIDLISKINAIATANDLIIKRAGGESTISTGRGNTMFPDVVLYGNKEQSIILQGWELKMPDVPIEDETFIKDAQQKAIALNLNSCLIWNFTYAVLYIRGEKNTFSKLKQWDATSHIRTRADVETYRTDWEKLLEEIVLDVNSYFVSGDFRNATLGDIISESTITTLIQRNKEIIAEKLKTAAFRDAVMAAYIDNWWLGVKSEYEHDETDKYKAYAKTIILNWANRIIFAHIIKNRQNGALVINELDYDTTPSEANQIFQKITAKCDFYNVFSAVRYNDILPELTWQDFAEYSNFLKSNGIENLNQEALQNILEGSVATSKRAINGQYTTPPELAKLLVRLSVKDWTDTILDCCCGTGTIPKAAIEIKRTQLSPKDAVESVWACDKYKYPLQVANISMTDSDTINLANRLFQHNALSLTIGDDISIVNPETGEEMHLSLPAFGTVVSNLPFVPFEIIPDDDKDEISKMPLASELDGRSDLYCYIATKIADVIKPGGTLGIIVSNSWLGTNAGTKLIEVLRQKYYLKQVHLSGKGRWFKNADVVTTIIVLEKKGSSQKATTDFWLWKQTLEQLTTDSDNENILVNSALLGTELDKTVSRLSKYAQSQIDDLLELNVCYNALFHDIDWLLNVKDKIIPINEVYHVFRGNRRGWDALFYPQAGEHRIEKQYLKKVLINARNVNRLTATADRDAFCCGVSTADLEKQGHIGALEWITKFVDQRNGVGKPLPTVLKRTGMEWYELQDNEIAEVFTMMNPDQRLFFAKFETPSFVNQRLIGLTHKASYSDEELNHALLNSMFTMFYIEASGFGRGLGVLDVNKDSIANCYMLNPKLVSQNDRTKIIAAFEKLKSRQIMRVSEELSDDIRLEFEHTVLKSFGIDDYFDKIKSSLLSMQETRATVRE
ncbi:N-6 DNA methylase [Agathobaculum sp. NSJ-28]|uniref:N-6 DNA methylase n=2 Tax=Agathobaculum TaxID=2048137 RepID=A0A923LU74_9FIRM|nr:N-6 DNA methylase [Agathobaculum ammoniilyticum]MBC5724758.1 N-6 DNA methylase [Agathobaculum faecis]MCU6788552.1 site-specific DNA-methyltransferase [Agathobaculum ammoniilyticum]